MLAASALRRVEAAPAKINLALHLVARQSDGYHRLDSVVAFIEHGDTLHVSPAEDGQLTLRIEGAFADGLPLENNLVLRAAERLRQHAGVSLGAHLLLQKETPIGAGLGGGSSDAAAALRGLNQLWQLDYPLPMLAELSEPLGADIPACVFSAPLRMEGIGQQLSPVPHLPSFPLVLAYPHLPLWTPDVYRATDIAAFSGQLPPLPGMGAPLSAWQEWLHESRNDLQPPAIGLQPQVQSVLDALSAGQGCMLARMSGSGSACFALYHDDAAAQLAAQEFAAAHPQWWVRATRTLAATF